MTLFKEADIARSSWTPWILLAPLALFSAYLLLTGPLLTNDGPIHVHFGDLLWRSLKGGDPFQRRIYTLAPRLGSNTLSEDILAALLPLIGPSRAEALIQAACFSLPPLAAAWAFHALRPGSSWVAIGMAPLMFQQLLFLGLYNYILSLAGFFVVLAIYLSTSASQLKRLTGIAFALVVTLLLHPMGFIAAALALILFEIARAGRGLIRGRSILAVIQSGLPFGLILAAVTVLAALLSSGGGRADYGLGPKRRLLYLLELKLLWINGPGASVYILVVGLIFIMFSLLIVYRLWRSRSDLSKPMTFEALLLFCLFFGVSLTFPDTLGGGWTHFRRAAFLPLVGAMFVIASLDWNIWVRRLAVGGWLIAALGLAGNAVIAQTEARAEAREYRAAGALVGERCAVAPVIFSRWLTKGPLADVDLGYEPFYQEATRWSTGSDRLVLFDFLARLSIYPVRLRPGLDPQDLLYGWSPRRHETEIDHLNLKRFEDATGIPVDYLLVRYDGRTALTPDQQKLLTTINSLSGGLFTQIFQTKDGSLRLLKRSGRGDGCSSRP